MMPPVTSCPSTVNMKFSLGPVLVNPRKIQVGTDTMSPARPTNSPACPSTPQRKVYSPATMTKTSAVKCRCSELVTPLGIAAPPTL